MMRRLLEKERLWFWLYIGTNVAAVVVGGIYAALLLLANPFSPITLLLLGIIWLLDIYVFCIFCTGCSICGEDAEADPLDGVLSVYHHLELGA